MGIILELLSAAINWPVPVIVTQENRAQTLDDFACDLEKVHQAATTSGTFNFKIVAVIRIKTEKTAHDGDINRYPYRSSPV